MWFLYDIKSSYLISQNPHPTANNPIKTLLPIYNRAIRVFPDSKSFILSAEKVEKVVNPPQNPVIKRNLKCE
jgi:hypothetical protein